MEDKLKNITRLEVIDETGRAYTKHRIDELTLSFQDEDKTLKIFITPNPNLVQ
ncbi:MAG: hypothetical protein ACRBCT_00270 [Alphaproteobacteria bacterium]